MGFFRKVYAFLIDTVQTLVLVFAVFLVVYVFLFRPFQVSGNSMLPNFLDKEYILTNIIGLKFTLPKFGDVIVFKAPPDPEKDYIKRVIGVPGDTIMVAEGNVYVNQKLLDESAFLGPSVKTYGGLFLRDSTPVTVPANDYFVMGDNRTASSDSREWKFVPFSSIVGESLYVYWPPDKMGEIKNPYN
jgi:signal peptidase I